MNLVVDDAVEVKLAAKGEEEKRRHLGKDSFYAFPSSAYQSAFIGQILLKGDNVSLIQNLQ